MDPKAQMPDIKAEVNKVDDGKKKGAGLFGLFGGGSGGAAGGLGGLGAGAAGGGGLLATKAGMLALVLMGSAVAGGIGLAGYKMFGPGDADKAGGNLSLFAPKPQQAASEEVAPASADGSSASLGMMAQAAAKDKEPDASASAAAPAAAPTDKTADDPARAAAAADAAARAASGGANTSGMGAGAAGSMGKGLANVKKLGALSGASSGGGSTSASSGAAGRLGDNLASASKNGATSGFSRGGPGAKASSARGVAARGGRGARAQARNVMGDQANGRAGSSFAAGRTYDGSATQSGGAIGPDGGAIGMGGAGDGTAAQPKSLAANSAPNVHEQEPPIPTPKHMVTPWEKAVQRVQMLAMAAMVLAMIAGKLMSKGKPYTWIAQWIIGVILAAMAVYAMSLSYQIMTGPNGQKAQGLVALAGAAGIAVLAGMVMSGSDGFGGKDMSLKNATGLMMLGGGLSLISMIGGMFMPKPKPVEVKDGEKTPDIAWIEIVKSPPDYRV